MRYCLIFFAYPGADWDVFVNGSTYEPGVLWTTPQTRLEVLPLGAMEWELRFDAVPLGRLVAVTRDLADEVPPAIP